jgi:hypothetical protein
MNKSAVTPEQRTSAHPSFAEAFRFWVKLGFISFGGPAGQIAIMQTELVDRKKWISQSRFLHALNYCMLLPGPEAACQSSLEPTHLPVKRLVLACEHAPPSMTSVSL